MVQVHVLLFVCKHDEMLFLITNTLEAIMEKLSSLNWNGVVYSIADCYIMVYTIQQQVIIVLIQLIIRKLIHF